MRILLSLTFTALALSLSLEAQRSATGSSAAAARVTVSGFVTDAGSGERMIDATVYERASFAGTTTNSYGFYSLPLQEGKAELIVSYLGYSPDTLVVQLSRDTVINFSLVISSSEIAAVTVTASGRRAKIESTQMSMIDVPVEKFLKLPVIFGEADVLKVIQLLPGV